MGPFQYFGVRTLFFGIVIILAASVPVNGCDEMFEGFGIYLGSVNHFETSPPGMVSKVFDKTYNDLGIRFYRTSYESAFSLEPNVYEIACRDDATWICSWIEVQQAIAKYPDTKIMASIWSPPHYMKNMATKSLLVEKEIDYHYFIQNITHKFQSQFNITIERISPVNEPENIFAPWEHTNMFPQQLCRMVHEFHDPLISVCPEGSYYWISQIYSNAIVSAGVTCLEACEIFGTHAYALSIVGGNIFKAYYDLFPYRRKIPNIPIWQTEVCPTFGNSAENQMREALDLSINIANFVGHTCVQRYYFWYSYTFGSSGESLMWGTPDGGLTLPKTYFAYKHFTHASQGGAKKVDQCKSGDLVGLFCLKFGESKAVMVNNLESAVSNAERINCVADSFCCTTHSDDWNCSVNGDTLPRKSVCSCVYTSSDDNVLDGSN